LGIAERGKIGSTRVHTSDLAAAVLAAVILVSAVYRLAT
jgi:hypothetical protein